MRENYLERDLFKVFEKECFRQGKSKDFILDFFGEKNANKLALKFKERKLSKLEYDLLNSPIEWGIYINYGCLDKEISIDDFRGLKGGELKKIYAYMGYIDYNSFQKCVLNNGLSILNKIYLIKNYII